MQRSTFEGEGDMSLRNCQKVHTSVAALDSTRPKDLPNSLASKPNFERKVGIIAFRCGRTGQDPIESTYYLADHRFA